MEPGIADFIYLQADQTVPQYLLLTRNLLSANTNLETNSLCNLLWTIEAAVLACTANNSSENLNWSSFLSFHFDRLLERIDRTSIFETIEHYRENKQEIDAAFSRLMSQFIADLQDVKDELPYERVNTSARELPEVACSSLISTGYCVTRLGEARSEVLLSILFHFRILEHFACVEDFTQSTYKLIDDVETNLQSQIGLGFITKQLLENQQNINSYRQENTRFLLVSTREISVAVAYHLNLGRHASIYAVP